MIGWMGETGLVTGGCFHPRSSCPMVERWSASVVIMPCSEGLAEDVRSRVAAALRDFFSLRS